MYRFSCKKNVKLCELCAHLRIFFAFCFNLTLFMFKREKLLFCIILTQPSSVFYVIKIKNVFHVIKIKGSAIYERFFFENAVKCVVSHLHALLKALKYM